MELQASSTRTLLSVAAASRQFHKLSNPLIYRLLRFHFTRSRGQKNRMLIKGLIEHGHLAGSVREVQVLWAPNARYGHGEEGKRDLELLGQLLPLLTGLKVFM